ncbi:MAG: outer membrane beta-barrel protein [Deltaproteobacteria bacterium]|nr:outer membrane beta-barrel protein [Deltaproteobacteria bacterium]
MNKRFPLWTLLLFSLLVSFARIEALELEIHGDVTTLIGWQETDKDALNIGQGPRGLLGDQLANINNDPNEETFGIFLDQVELDFEKQLGASFGWRLDMDVSPHRDNTGDGDNDDNRDLIDLEQAYIEGSPIFYKSYDPEKGGFKLTAGRFNSHVGYDPIDRKGLNTASFSSIHRFLLPHNISGGKATLFNERWSWETFVVQGIQNQDIDEKTISPTYGFNLKRVLGERKSGLQLSGAAGPQEEAKGRWTYLVDLATHWNLSASSQLGLEGVYRTENNGACGDGKTDCVYYGGMIQFVKTWTDQLSGTLRYGYLRDQNNGGLTGASQAIHDGTVALSYSFMEVAKFVLEYRQDVQVSTGPISNRENAVVYGAGGLFVYEF